MAKKIFIVDDALFMREMLKKILEKNGGSLSSMVGLRNSMHD